MAGKKSELEIDPQIEIKSVVKRADKREDTRSRIALYYVIGFLIIVFSPIVIFAFFELSVTETRDLLLAISGILSGPLGFIIGYYFKAHADEG